MTILKIPFLDTERLPAWTLCGAMHLPPLWLRGAFRDLASDFPIRIPLFNPPK